MGAGKGKTNTVRGGSYGSSSDSNNDKTPTFGDSLNTYENHIRNNVNETCAVYSAKGEMLILKSDGKADSVAFSLEEVSKMDGGIISHNHPKGTSFSVEDLMIFVKSNAKEIRAVSGTRNYSLKRNSRSLIIKNGNELVNDFISNQNSYKSILDKEYYKARDDYKADRIRYSTFQSKVDDLNDKINNYKHSWLKENAGKYGYIYKNTPYKKEE